MARKKTAEKKQPLVLIALSGGVDSAVTARILHDAGYHLVGVSHRVWPESKCCTTACFDRSAEECKKLGIPFFGIDCLVPFCKSVVDPFVQAYLNGVTPNPCVLCNEHVRFHVMIEKFFQDNPQYKTQDYVLATGHYANIEIEDGHYYLCRGQDKTKDQAYMLHRLSQDQLAHSMFPLGKLQKAAVRKMAEKWQLSSAKTKDSQDACFIENRCSDFIVSYTGITVPQGPFVTKEGKIIGLHRGITHYTRGQRRSLDLPGGPWYVLDIRKEDNTVVLGRKEDLLVSAFSLTNMNWIFPNSKKPITCTVQTRYHGDEQRCVLTPKNKHEAEAEFEHPFFDITPGQSAVFYQGERVIGGGIIEQFIR